MVKKTAGGLRGLSNSDRKIQKLYQEAINEIRDNNTAAMLIEQAAKETGKKAPENQPSKSAKRIKPVHKSQKLAERPSRGSLSIPVSKLLPFRYDPRGYHFPVDFRKDDTDTWVPRTTDDSAFGSETTDSECSDGCFRGKARESCNSEDERVFGMDELLQVLPLRAEDDEYAGCLSPARSGSSSSVEQSLPPLYKREVWREIMARACTNCHSIPAKKGASGAPLLVIGNEENYSRERRKHRRIGLVERRARLRAAAARKSRHLEK